jgi:hypothetical protein
MEATRLALHPRQGPGALHPRHCVPRHDRQRPQDKDGDRRQRCELVTLGLLALNHHVIDLILPRLNLPQ